MDKLFHIADLIVKKKTGKISTSEEKSLNDWIQSSSENEAFYRKISDKKYITNKLQIYQLFNKEKVWQEINRQIPETKIIHFNSRKLLQIAASILIPLMLVSGAAFYYLNILPAKQIANIDLVIQPGQPKAMLVLSDGSIINLQKDTIQTTIKEKLARIAFKENKLSYESEESGSKLKSIAYNKLITPPGGTYSIKLADGTQVWLNANSSLKYPVSFTDSIRQVYLEGEAYFDVTHTGKPFRVNSGELNVNVLGTEFNVSAYTNDNEIKTTLVEGKVFVAYTDTINKASSGEILKPNEQAVLSKADNRLAVQSVNTSYFTSWMAGKLEFDNESLDEVMKRLSRWYNFEYDFKNESAKNYHFSARLDNTENISEILKMLELTADVKFKLKDKTIVIL